jgi:hypothetical protein
MPTPTYTPLATVTLGSATSSVTFGSIPSTYRDLILVFTGTRTGNNNVLVRVNGDSGSNYNYVSASSSGSSGSSNNISGATELPSTLASLQTNSQLNVVWQFMDYSATDKHKVILTRFNQTSTEVSMFANRWANTVAINSIRVFSGNENFGSGSTFSIYGVIA